METLEYPQIHPQNPSRLDDIQLLEFYLWLPLPYGLHKYGVISKTLL
jgi:hypothetical protein